MKTRFAVVMVLALLFNWLLVAQGKVTPTQTISLCRNIGLRYTLDISDTP
jgi:hypothetical protein